MVFSLLKILFSVIFSSVAGSDFKDDSLNLMPFFSASCYTGFGDEPKVTFALHVVYIYG